MAWWLSCVNVVLMSVVEIFMAALLSGVITDEEVSWLAARTPSCSRVEAVMLERLERLLAQQVLRRGIRPASPAPLMIPS